MSNNELKEKLNKIADNLVPVAGELMSRACRDNFIHEENCNCTTCKAFFTVHDCQNKLGEIIKEI